MCISISQNKDIEYSRRTETEMSMSKGKGEGVGPWYLIAPRS
jgi:hypothetical protein